jgi:hypothetical protein
MGRETCNDRIRRTSLILAYLASTTQLLTCNVVLMIIKLDQFREIEYKKYA